MNMIGNSELSVFPLCLGTNIFGWTADQRQAFEVLDAFTGGGGDFLDTADSYSAWIPGHSGGESETIIGAWMASRGTRDDVVLATKVGGLPGRKGLSGPNIRMACEDSLRRLGTDHIDLYWAHYDDPETPIGETLEAFDTLIREGKVRYIGASNFGPERLAESLQISRREGLASYIALQQHYNLVERELYEGPLAKVVADNGLSSIPYYGLARGFLTGKYRTGSVVESARAAGAAPYLESERALAVLEALDEIAEARDVEVAAIALAWLAAQPTVAAPIASARSVEQVSALLDSAELTLSEAELVLLNAASA
ncbi:aldo/keto reductase [Rhizohabitans arisaemae]|uniref:aldo/keto reductase n=1 Tax=Rhizohabitans arisaemae TaxID=2720610 RepID=UPI0024B17FA6|nr:aldo/keto reductase [Rhizohabitans arisaemae]